MFMNNFKFIVGGAILVLSFGYIGLTLHNAQESNSVLVTKLDKIIKVMETTPPLSSPDDVQSLKQAVVELQEVTNNLTVNQIELHTQRKVTERIISKLEEIQIQVDNVKHSFENISLPSPRLTDIEFGESNPDHPLPVSPEYDESVSSFPLQNFDALGNPIEFDEATQQTIENVLRRNAESVLNIIETEINPDDPDHYVIMRIMDENDAAVLEELSMVLTPEQFEKFSRDFDPMMSP